MQQVVRGQYPGVPLGQHISGDEAAVLGAATQLILTKDWGRLISPSFPRLVVNDLPPPSVRPS